MQDVWYFQLQTRKANLKILITEALTDYCIKNTSYLNTCISILWKSQLIPYKDNTCDLHRCENLDCKKEVQLVCLCVLLKCK